MYIAIFMGEKKESVTEIKNLSAVLLKALDVIENQELKECTKIYDSREAFLEDIDAFMQDDTDGYVIGVDTDRNTFERFYIRYDWIYNVVEEEE